MKPIIGISGSHIIDQGGRFPGYKRAYVNDNYVQSVVAAGGVPHIIPVVYDDDVIMQQATIINGLVLSGGQDITALLYGEEPLQKQGNIFPERDHFETQLVKLMLEQNKPVFAICRGIQLVNVAFGGTLYQDLSYIDDCTIKHDQYSRHDLATHSITIEKNSHLYGMLGPSHLVNSFHHQAVKDVAKGFKVVARSKDHIIEAIEYEGDEYLLAVQWHPEMMALTNRTMLQLFINHVEQASRRMSR